MGSVRGLGSSGVVAIGGRCICSRGSIIAWGFRLCRSRVLVRWWGPVRVSLIVVAVGLIFVIVVSVTRASISSRAISGWEGSTGRRLFASISSCIVLRFIGPLSRRSMP